MTTDTMEKALRALGYAEPSPDGRGWGRLVEESAEGEDGAIVAWHSWEPIHTDLASLLRRCDEAKPIILVDLFNHRPVGFRAYVNYEVRSTAYNGNSSDPTEALVLALAAMHDAKEKP